MDKKPQRIAKENIVLELREKLKNNSTTLLLDYKGITVSEDTTFRRQMREAGVDYGVSRNTLLKRAANDEGINELDEYLNNTTSVAFSNDPVTLAKIIVDFSKEHKAIKIKAGILDGKILPAEQVKNLAKLPSREVLLAKVLGGMQAPLTGFAGTLQGLLRGFVSCLDQVRQQKESA